jgi:RimJ/RimL family protein N-acetyltransferase
MVVLEGPRVRLRPLTPDDFATVFNWFRDPEIVAPYDRYFADSYEPFTRSLSDPALPADSLTPRFGIAPRAGPGLVGVVGHYSPHPVLETVEVWYIVGDRAARGHGYGKEAVRLLVDHLWATTSVGRVGITCDVENLASVRLAEGLGFRREGRLSAAFFHHGRWHDVFVYGLTRADGWPPQPGA